MNTMTLDAETTPSGLDYPQSSESSVASPRTRPNRPAMADEETLYVDSPSMMRNHPIGFFVACLLVPIGVGAVILLVWYIRARSTELTITNLRSRLHKGWLSREITEVWHRDIRNVQLTQSFPQRMLGTGRIGISSSGQDGIEIEAVGFKNPDEIKHLIDQYRREASHD